MMHWLRSFFRVTSETASRRILAGTAHRGMRVAGSLQFRPFEKLCELPGDLTIDSLDVTSCVELKSLPRGLRCQVLTIRGCRLSWLPSDLIVSHRLDAEGCRQLRGLPYGFTVPTLALRNCTGLTELPRTLQTRHLDISGCTRLSGLPRELGPSVTQLVARDCTSLTTLPETFVNLVELNVSGCASLTELPEGMQVHGSIDVAGSGLCKLPATMNSTRVLWRGVEISRQIAFEPETIRIHEILDVPNVEVRRIILERVGLERFMDAAVAEVIHRDRDAGGERQLLLVRDDEDEDIMCVAVNCPSTGKRYLLRVPPTMQTCHQAIAWTAGFTDPDDYRPVRET